MEQSLFDLFKAFDYIEGRHKSDIFLSECPEFPSNISIITQREVKKALIMQKRYFYSGKFYTFFTILLFQETQVKEKEYLQVSETSFSQAVTYIFLQIVPELYALWHFGVYSKIWFVGGGGKYTLEPFSWTMFANFLLLFLLSKSGGGG